MESLTFQPILEPMNKHTPGPWLAVVTDTTCGGEPAIWEITDKHGGVIAEDISHNPANASLIAAAPDMFEALQAIVSDYSALMRSQGASADIGGPSSPFTAGEWVGSRLGSPIANAQELISKAKGGAK